MNYNYNFLILQKPRLQQGNETRRRWDSLYDLEKMKLQKFESKRRNKEKKELEDEQSICTFSPQLNQSKSNKSLLLGMPMSERIVQYNKKKDLKITTLLQKEIKKDEELVFSPKIIDNYKIEIGVAENVIQSPLSYHNYVERLKQMRTVQNQQKNKEVNAVGSGKHWRNKITVPSGPSFLDRKKLSRSQSFNYMNEKFYSKEKNPLQESTTNFNNNNGTNGHINLSEILDEKYKTKKDKFGYENIFNFQKNVVKINRPIGYQDAVNLLHEELHSRSVFY